MSDKKSQKKESKKEAKRESKKEGKEEITTETTIPPNVESKKSTKKASRKDQIKEGSESKPNQGEGIQEDELLNEELVDDKHWNIQVQSEQDLALPPPAPTTIAALAIENAMIPSESLSVLTSLSETNTKAESMDEISPSPRNRGEEDLLFDQGFIHELRDRARSENIPFFLDFPSELFLAVNNGDFHKIALLSETYFTPDCRVKIDGPDTFVDVVGAQNIAGFYEALIASHPDGFISLHKIAMSKNEGYLNTRCSVRFQGTLLHVEYFLKFHGGEKLDLTPHLDQKKYTTEELEEFRHIEDEANKSGRKLVVYVKLEINLRTDYDTLKISEFHTKCRLSSFRLADSSL